MVSDHLLHIYISFMSSIIHRFYGIYEGTFYVHCGKTPTYKAKFSIFRVYSNKGIEMVKLDLSSQDNAFIRGMNYLPKVKKFLASRGLSFHVSIF